MYTSVAKVGCVQSELWLTWVGKSSLGLLTRQRNIFDMRSSRKITISLVQYWMRHGFVANTAFFTYSTHAPLQPLANHI